MSNKLKLKIGGGGNITAATTPSDSSYSTRNDMTDQPPPLQSISSIVSSSPSSSSSSSGLTLRVRRRPRTILQYLCTLESDVLNILYRDESTCLTIFRSLSTLSKQYIMRLLYVVYPVNISVLHSWIISNQLTQIQHKKTMDELWELKLLITTQQDTSKSSSSSSSSSPLSFCLNPIFQSCLQSALQNENKGTKNNIDPSSVSVSAPVINEEEINEYAQQKWDQILYFMVGATKIVTGSTDYPSSSSSSVLTPPHIDIQTRLINMGLMSSSSSSSSSVITSIGFTFLFKDITSQIWEILLNFIDSITATGKLNERDQALLFLFKLNFLQMGKGYSVDSLTYIQKKLLVDLSHLGIIYLKKPNSKYYYPTRLAGILSASPTPTKQEEGFILVETTYRIYAFTTSPFHITLLNLFARLDVRLPNMVVGLITKESVRRALKNNISSQEIISYLEQYAHPQLRANTPILPEAVVDQIRSWEKERNRMSFSDGILLSDFGPSSSYSLSSSSSSDATTTIRRKNEEESMHEYQYILHEANQQDIVLWYNITKRLIVIKPEGLNFIKNMKAKYDLQKQQIKNT